MVDPISDMLNRIRNAQAVLKETVDFPFSNLKYEIARVLEKSGLIGKVEKKKKKSEQGKKIQLKPFLEIALKYEDSKPLISGLKRVSKSGQRIYTPFKEIQKVRGGYGLAIISTSKGLMTDREARKNKIGGEVICKVW
ncbi:MAG: 30S ribosomal protein S8 [Candidatus Nealsonbacteria bacterium RIFCSPLOWO2_01_FULL_41_9]|uniref:Small ribosomal subunit protein uS8 n=1 Tax=Candidatus Nealsonbacteria bacterium RIFCSPLOWO2_01_FULL_41_9 TaxID=1801671 RepID=A0A1G2EEJ5_9BACT|nr:MAG: 30S ribosomal protein S8 [Candidatus Nealsonbacteria bacterium RIFCSPLOWO2_01_FULL_41_9]